MKCTSCGTEDPNIYVGFSKVECTNPSCTYFKPPKVDWKKTLSKMVNDTVAHASVYSRLSPTITNRSTGFPVQGLSKICVNCKNNVNLSPDADSTCICGFKVIHPSIVSISIGRILTLDGYNTNRPSDNPRAILLNATMGITHGGHGTVSLMNDFLTGHEPYIINSKEWMVHIANFNVHHTIQLAEVVFLRRTQENIWIPDGWTLSPTSEEKIFNLFRSGGMKIMIRYDKSDTRINDIFK